MATPYPSVVSRLRDLSRPDASDPQLLHEFVCRRDESAFAALVRRHGPLVRGVCRRLLGDADADDAFRATFLTLARKAASVRGRESVAPWLYAVACRVARRAQRSAVRRAAHEARVPPPVDAVPIDAAWDELRLVLDEELNRLPEKLRAPLVLCYLQGQSRDEAAQHLGCSFGTLKRRLEDGRNLLRLRLARRGLTLAAAGLAVAASESALPAALVESTVRIAAAGPVPPAIAALVPGTLAMIPLRLKLTFAALVLLLGGVAAGSLWPAGAAQPPRKTPAADAAGSPKTPAADAAGSLKRDQYNDALPDGAVARLGAAAFVHGDSAGRLAFSADGSRVLSISFQIVCVWDAATGQLLAEFQRPAGIGSWLDGAFSADGKTVCLVHDDAVARVYDLGTKLETRSFSLKGEEPRRTQLMGVAFSPDGKTLLARETDESLRVWDVPTGGRGALLRVEGQVIRHFAVAPGARTAATFDAGAQVRVWDLATGQELLKFAGTERDVARFTISPDGKLVAVVCQSSKEEQFHGTTIKTFITDSYVRLWDVATGQMVRHIEAHPKGIGSVRFAPDSRSVWTAGYGLDPFVRRWDVATGKPLAELPRHGNAVTALAVTADGKTVVTQAHGILRLWDAGTLKEKLPFDAHRGSVSKVVVLPGGRLLTGGGDGAVREWDLATGRPLARFEAQPSWVSDVAQTPNGRRIATIVFSHETPEIRVFDAAGKLLRTLKGKGKAIGALAYAPDGRTLAAADYGGRVILWDAETGAELRTLKAKGDRGVDRLAFTPDGKRLLAAGIDDPTCVWDLASGALVATWDTFGPGLMRKAPAVEHTERAMGVAFSPDLKYVALGVQGKPRLLICEAETGNLVQTIGGLPGTPVSIAFAPDGKTIAWGTWEGPVHLVDRATGTELRQYTGHRGRVLDLAFTPDGKRLISASEDSTALVWEIK